MFFRFFVFFVVFSSFLSFSQKKQFNLIWADSKNVIYTGDDSSKSIFSFQEDNFIYDAVDKSVLFAASLPFASTNVTVESVTYKNVPITKLSNYNLTLIKDKIKVNVSSTYSRGNVGSYVSFSPIIYKDGSYKIVSTINLSFSNSARSINSVKPTVVTNSSLSDGLWYKFYITETGVYSLTKSFLSSIGVDVNNVNPKNIRLFGNGGKSIPLINSDVALNDVTENAVKFVGEDDGVFNDNDYLLFYGIGSLGWDQQNDSFINPYSDKTYYYINVSNSYGKRIKSLQEPSGVPSVVFNTYNETQFYEVDKNNLVQLGRRWFGDSFDVNSSQRFSFEFPNIDLSEPVKLTVKAAATSLTSTNMQILLNSVLSDNLFFSASDSNVLARGDFYSGFQNVNSNTLNIDLNYLNNGNPSANAYLDYISIESVSFLRFYGSQFSFVNNQATSLLGVGEYVIRNSSAVSELWDVTDPFNVYSKQNQGDNNFSFKSVLGSEKKYILLTENDFYTPSVDSGTSLVLNSNIKGTIFNNSQGVFEDIDYVVITPNELKSQAERLANINERYNGLRTKVVSLEDLYSEFNTGNQDIGAIRNFVKYLYQNAAVDKLKYLCLFGDASFDMKDRIPGNTNLIPSFHSLQSFSTISGFVSDDFFGMMDESEGSMNSSDRLDIAVGRIVAGDLQQASEMVTKIEQFYQQESYGSWRNRVTIISDDVDVSGDAQLENQLDLIADQIVAERPFINMVKIHSDSYIQESSSGGDVYPKAKEAILNNIQLGSSVVNYFGHGGEEGLAAERLFLKSDAKNILNTCKYNVFVTITCDFTRFDNPLRETGGELVYWNTKGGAVSLIATTRKIFFSTAISINKELSKYLFAFDGAGYVSVAEALRLAKNNIISNNKRVVFNVGDPALKLPFPKSNIRLTHINDVLINDANVPNIEALGRVKLSGEIVGDNGQLLSGYNGELSTRIFDKNQKRSTLGNDGTRSGGELITLDYEVLGETIFRGNSSVVNGKFEVDFVVPRDISIPLGEGRISFYAKKNNELEDQTGVDTSVVVGGINENAPIDNQPPVVDVFMNNESFVSGGVTGQSPFLLLNLSDENGISSASGIGHDITAVLDGDEANPVVLNDYYETELDDFTKGKVKYQYRDLEPGLHTLVVKAWDVYNNSVSAELQFMVVNENEELVVSRVLNYPNPFVSYTEFWFNHNSSADLDVMVQVYTVTGKLVKTLRGNSSSNNKSDSNFLFRGLPWDGKDDFGDKIGKGVYVYKLTVRSLGTNKKVVKFEKLVIL